MFIDTTKMHGNLYQGSIPPGNRVVADVGFDVLVLCAWENQDPANYPGVEVIQAPGDDVNEWPIEPAELEAWQRASLIVADRIRTGKKVLVTCIGGYNRSGMVVAMALNHITSWSASDIVEHVQSMRAGALHNKSFTRWLSENLKESP